MEFGELNITASRAFWDDYEDVDGDQPIVPIAIEWKWSNGSIEDFKNLKNFIILEGERIRNQISHQGDESEMIPICHLSQQKVFIYMLKGKNTAICLSEETNLNSFAIIAESLTDLMNKSAVEDINVVTVNLLPISSYKIGTDEKLGADIIIRGINPKIPMVSELIEPNILTGISAGVASHRHHMNKPFSSYAIYMDSHKTHLVGSPMVAQFFELIGISSKMFTETHLNESSLYT